MKKISGIFLKSFLTALPFMGVLALCYGGVLLAKSVPAAITGSASTANLRSEASKYLKKSEKAGASVVSIKHEGYYYNYIPFEINGSIAGDFPGIMLDHKGNAVTDKKILTALFKYPGVLRQFSYTVAKFDAVAEKKAKAVEDYCRILKVQEIKMDEIQMQGNVVGFIYHGVKLAADAAGAVKAAVKGLAALAKDLAKNKLQETVMSYFTDADDRAILESANKAYASSRHASEACNAAQDAWKSLVSNSGSLTTVKAESATADLALMYQYEAQSIAELRTALQRVNNYPKLVTKISKTKFNKGMNELEKLIAKLRSEQENWKGENEQVNLIIEAWADEQINRAPALMPIPAPAAGLTSCQSIDLSNDYSLYKYTKTAAECTSYADGFTSNELKLRCADGNPQWRKHFVKKINTAGADKVRIKADLLINDYGADYTGGAPFFASMCPSGGVKYDNYSYMMILSADPRPKLDAECNKAVSDADWPKCGLANAAGSVTGLIGSCGVPKCASSMQCDVSVDTKGLNEIYIVYYATDPWVADIEGVMKNAEVCPGN